MTVTPTTASVYIHARQQFTATDGPVTWSVESGGGSIDADGLYEAGATAGSVTIRATSDADAEVYAEATITVSHPFAGLDPVDVRCYKIGYGAEPDPISAWVDHETNIGPTFPDIPLVFHDESPLAALCRPTLDRSVDPDSDAMMAVFVNAPGTFTIRPEALAYQEGGGFGWNVVRSSLLSDRVINFQFGGTDSPLEDYSDPGPRKIATNISIQYDFGEEPVTENSVDHIDGHICNVDLDTGEVYEAYQVTNRADGTGINVSNGFAYNLFTGDWAPNVAEGDPKYIAPGTARYVGPIVSAATIPLFLTSVRYDELYIHGRIRHMIAWTMPNVKIMGHAIWPATGIAYSNLGNSDGEWGKTMPYGSVMRLKESWYTANVSAVDPETKEDTGPPIGGWGAGARVILRALYEYGAILTDGGNNASLWALSDSRYYTENKWPDIVTLYQCSLANFEVLDHSSDKDTLTWTITPEVSATGGPYTVRVDCHYWELHPEAHPGSDDRPYYIALRDGETSVLLGTVKAGNPANNDGNQGRVTPARPYTEFEVTLAPGSENLRFYPISNPGGLPGDFQGARPAFWTTEANAPITLDVSPDPVAVAPGGSVTLTIGVDGASQASLRSLWIDSGPSGTTLNPVTRVLTAGATEGSGAIDVRLNADPAVALTILFAVTTDGGGGGGGDPPGVVVSVSPSTATVTEGGTQQFTATVTGTANGAVTWRIIAAP